MNTIKSILILFLIISFFTFKAQKHINMSNYETATFGGGCFWCTEAIFEQLKGVVTVKSGYSGGQAKNPTYEEVCSGNTGHAEVIQVEFKPEVISYTELLEVFFKTHDPTTLNQQGADKGSQYRSIILFHTAQQRVSAMTIIRELDKQKIWDNPIVTELVEYTTFYSAEDYHQDYYNSRGGENQYCQLVITPKLEKFEKIFKDKLK